MKIYTEGTHFFLFAANFEDRYSTHILLVIIFVNSISPSMRSEVIVVQL